MRVGTVARWPLLVPSANEFTRTGRKRKPSGAGSDRQSNSEVQ